METGGELIPQAPSPQSLPPRSPHYLCQANRKDGKPCTVPHMDKSDFCLAHNPAITKEQRREWSNRRKKFTMKKVEKDIKKAKTLDDLKEILSKRIDMFEAQWSNVTTPETVEMLCQLFRTYVSIIKADEEEDAGIQGWRMRKFG